jgi:hypothetical protein
MEIENNPFILFIFGSLGGFQILMSSVTVDSLFKVM